MGIGASGGVYSEYLALPSAVIQSKVISESVSPCLQFVIAFLFPCLCPLSQQHFDKRENIFIVSHSFQKAHPYLAYSSH